jgi:hypothetical protein
MSGKKISILVVLGISAIFTGAALGILDIFGFIDGRHALSFSLLLLTAFSLYISLISVFLLDFTDRRQTYTYLSVISALFFVSFFIVNQHILLSLVTAFSYALFLNYSYTQTLKRAKMYIRFVPREIFFPILKRGFTYFLILMAILAYTQSQKLISENSLVSTSLIRMATKPTILMLNQQINSQLGPILETEAIENLPRKQKEKVIYEALNLTVKNMASPKTKTIYGFKPGEIPVQEAEISPEGYVDVTPIVEAMLPSFAFRLNEWVSRYASLAPIVVAALAYLLLQPIIIPLQLLESLITLIIFKSLLRTGFIHIRTEQQEVEIPYI